MKNKKDKKEELNKKNGEKSANLFTFLNQKKFFLIGILLILIFFLISKINQESKKNEIQKNLLPKAVKKLIQNENANISISNLKETNGVFEFQLTFKDQNNQKYTSYITKDGKILFTSGIKVEDLFKKTLTSNQQNKLTCKNLERSKQPILTVYVMADCPYGLQMQRVFKNVINTDERTKNNLRVEYIFNEDSNFETGELNALHGKEEAQENLRQICLREERPDFYWKYVSCYMKKANNSESCLNEAGIDANFLNACMKDKNRGLKYAKKDFKNTQKLGITGSPTLVLNNKQIISEEDFGGRNPNTIKEILCCSSDKKLAFCNKEFSKNNSAVSFSENDEQVGETNASSGGCH